VAKDDKKTITVVAQYAVASERTGQTIKGHDKAWALGMSLPTPVTIHFDKWVRIDKEKK
jgi:hypothetical protein